MLPGYTHIGPSRSKKESILCLLEETHPQLQLGTSELSQHHGHGYIPDQRILKLNGA